MSSMDSTASSVGDNTTNNNNRKQLLLVGGGHAHIQVVKSLNWASRPDDLDVTLVDLTSTPSYSGMVPATVAGLYEPTESKIQLRALTEWADIKFVEGRVTDLHFATTNSSSNDDNDNNPEDTNVATVVIDVNSAANDNNQNDDKEKTRTKQETLSIPFDAISLDIGSASRGVDDIPGVLEYTIPTRPISELVDRIEQTTQKLLTSSNNCSQQTIDESTPVVDVVVVGGGAAGIELAMALWGRWKSLVVTKNSNNNEPKDDELFRITVLDAGETLFPHETTKNRQALLKVLTERKIHIRHNVKVQRVNPNELVLLDSNETISFTHCIWATGATSHPLAATLRQRGLPVDTTRGWIRVNDYLQSVDTTNFPTVFAAGDCCTMERTEGINETSASPLPTPPKAGVYAVRAGPILIENLINCLYKTKPLKPYIPQDDFLKLIVCGDGKALGFRFGIPIEGRWVFQLKDAIDKSFMNLFQKQNLPTLVKGQDYDMSQYDATENRPDPISPIDAATILQRTDDEVDFEQAWNVLRDMAQDKDYRQSVLRHIHNQ